MKIMSNRLLIDFNHDQKKSISSVQNNILKSVLTFLLLPKKMHTITMFKNIFLLVFNFF